MIFKKALNEYGKQYSDIKHLARPNAINVDVMSTSIKNEDGEFFKIIYDEVRSDRNKYQILFSKKVDGNWERAGNPVKSKDWKDIIEAAVKAAEAHKLEPTKLRSKLKAFLADHVGRPTRKLFKK